MATNDTPTTLADIRKNLAEEELTLTQKLVYPEDSQNIKDITNAFNILQTRKNALRIQKLGNLFDTVTDQMEERFEKRRDEFSNRDLLDYMSTIQTALEKAQKGVDVINELPPITLTQHNQQFNITVGEPVLNRESRERVLAAINNIIKTNNLTEDLTNE